MKGRTSSWWGTVLDAPDPHALAEFYSRLLEWPIATDEPTWVVLNRPGESFYLGFHESSAYLRPVWPPVDGHQQMMVHLDIEVDDLDAAVADALDMGAALAEYQPQDTVRVLLDPIGHPFCLYLGS